MPPSQLRTPSPEDIQDAVQITLQNLADTLIDPGATADNRLRQLGDYIICWTMKYETSPEDADQTTPIFEGLIEAGVDEDLVQNLNKAAKTRKILRRISSLGYIPPSEEVRGIKRSAKSTALDRAEFIQGILEKYRTSSG